MLAPMVYGPLSRKQVGRTWFLAALILQLCGSIPKPARAADNDRGSRLSAGQTWTNSLGMVFRSVTNSPVLFSLWETRVRDFTAFVADSAYQPEELTTRLSDGSSRSRSWNHPGFPQNGDHPVVFVSWDDAQAFCSWLTQRERALRILATNEHYRLPTDAEWTMAIGPAKYPWPRAAQTASHIQAPDSHPDTGSDDRLWFPPPNGAGNYAGSEIRQLEFPFRALRNYTDGFMQTAPVGSFAMNCNGLYDLSGNVAELCQDWFRREMNSSELQLKLPFYSNDGGGRTYRVVRGASWIDSHPGLLRSDCHFFEFPDHRADNLGFRAVLVPK
jgi:formylglycine-generating enzyme required for sulfatase activity